MNKLEFSKVLSLPSLPSWERFGRSGCGRGQRGHEPGQSSVHRSGPGGAGGSWRPAKLVALLSLVSLIPAALPGQTTLDYTDPSDSADDIFNLPEGVRGIKLDQPGVNKTLPIHQSPLVKFLARQDDATQKELYWEDAPWDVSYYFPIRVDATHKAGIDVPTLPYNGSHIETPSGIKDKVGKHHLLAARVDNLQFLGGYYKYDFEARLKMYTANHDFSEIKDHGFLDLVTDNPHLGVTNRVHPGQYVDDYVKRAVENHSVVPRGAFEVRANMHHLSSMDGFAQAQNGHVSMAFDGVMHTYYDPGTNWKNAILAVDLGERMPVERIVLRWADSHYKGKYSLYAFPETIATKLRVHTASTLDGFSSVVRDPIPGVEPLLKALQFKDSEEYAQYRIYEGVLNPEKSLEATLRESEPSDRFDNNQIAASAWKKTNSYFWVTPQTRQVTDGVNELFQLKEPQNAESVRYLALMFHEKPGRMDQNGVIQLSLGGRSPKLLEMEVYAYPTVRHQTEDPRLFTYQGHPWILFNSTSSGKIYDDKADGGEGRSQYIARIHYNQNTDKFHVHGSEILKLQVPTGANNTFLKHGRYHVEKNLTPFVAHDDAGGPHTGNLMMIYGYDPLMVYTVHMDTGQMVEISKTDSDIRNAWGDGQLGPPRGGTPALWDSVNQRYITFFHSSIKSDYLTTVGSQDAVKFNHTYYTGALAFERNSRHEYRITEVTPPLLVSSWYEEYNEEGKKVAFAGGVSEHPDEPGDYYVSSGIADKWVDLTLVDDSTLSQCFAPVSPGKQVASPTQALDVYAVIGLSNAAGRAPIEARDYLSAPHVFMLEYGDAYFLAQEPMNLFSNILKGYEKQGLGPARAFGKLLAEAHPGKKFGLIVNARGGSSLATWLPRDHPLYVENARDVVVDDEGNKVLDANGNPVIVDRFGQTVARIQAAVSPAAGHDRHALKGVVILAGEGDLTDERRWQYPAVFQALVDSLRAAFNDPDLPVVTSTILYEADYKPKNDAQAHYQPLKPDLNTVIMEKMVPSWSNQNIAAVDTTGLRGIGDGTHYNSASQRVLACWLAKAMDHLVYGQDPGRDEIFDQQEDEYLNQLYGIDETDAAAYYYYSDSELLDWLDYHDYP